MKTKMPAMTALKMVKTMKDTIFPREGFPAEITPRDPAIMKMREAIKWIIPYIYHP